MCLSTGGGGGVGIPACLAGHMTRQQYISRCTVDVSQLVWRQQTGNIKCMMGYVTWYTPLGPHPSLGPHTPPPPQDHTPGTTPPPDHTTPPDHPPGTTHPLGSPPLEKPQPPQDHTPPPPRATPSPDPGNQHFNSKTHIFHMFF